MQCFNGKSAQAAEAEAHGLVRNILAASDMSQVPLPGWIIRKESGNTFGSYAPTDRQVADTQRYWVATFSVYSDGFSSVGGYNHYEVGACGYCGEHGTMDGFQCMACGGV